MAFKLTQSGFDVAPLAGGLDRWVELELPLEARPIELSTVLAMVADGSIEDGKTIAALCLWRTAAGEPAHA